jgi:hypothetical protein
MIDRCFNPACRRNLRYLRDGRVVRVIRLSTGEIGASGCSSGTAVYRCRLSLGG